MSQMMLEHHVGLCLEDACDCACGVECSSIICQKWHFWLCRLEFREANPVYSSMLGECMTTLLKTPLVLATTSGCKGRKLLTYTEVWAECFEEVFFFYCKSL